MTRLNFAGRRIPEDLFDALEAAKKFPTEKFEVALQWSRIETSPAMAQPNHLQEVLPFGRHAHKPMEIRRYQPGDEAAVWNVYFRATHESNSRDYHTDLIHRWAPLDQNMAQWRERLAEKRPFVAVLEDQIVGMAEIEESGFVDYFYVLPDFQGKGVGSKLLERIESEADAMSVCDLVADVSLTAKGFFESRGFRVTEARSHVIMGHDAPNFAMTKHLQTGMGGTASSAAIGDCP